MKSNNFGLLQKDMNMSIELIGKKSNRGFSQKDTDLHGKENKMDGKTELRNDRRFDATHKPRSPRSIAIRSFLLVALFLLLSSVAFAQATDSRYDAGLNLPFNEKAGDVTRRRVASRSRTRMYRFPVARD
jgi:hypothetical protein